MRLVTHQIQSSNYSAVRAPARVCMHHAVHTRSPYSIVIIRHTLSPVAAVKQSHLLQRVAAAVFSLRLPPLYLSLRRTRMQLARALCASGFSYHYHYSCISAYVVLCLAFS